MLIKDLQSSPQKFIFSYSTQMKLFIWKPEFNINVIFNQFVVFCFDICFTTVRFLLFFPTLFLILHYVNYSKNISNIYNIALIENSTLSTKVLDPNSSVN